MPKNSEIKFHGYIFKSYVFIKSFHEKSIFFVGCVKKEKIRHKNPYFSTKFLSFYICHTKCQFFVKLLHEHIGCDLCAKFFFCNLFVI